MVLFPKGSSPVPFKQQFSSRMVSTTLADPAGIDPIHSRTLARHWKILLTEAEPVCYT